MFMISFSSEKLGKNYFGPTRNLWFFSTAQTEKNLWTQLGKKLVKTSDKFLIKLRNYLIGKYASNSAVVASSLIKYIMSEVCSG